MMQGFQLHFCQWLICTFWCWLNYIAGVWQNAGLSNRRCVSSVDSATIRLLAITRSPDFQLVDYSQGKIDGSVD